MAPRFDPARAVGPLVSGFDRQGRFVVDGEAHPSVLLTPERSIGWEAPVLAELAPHHVAETLALDPLPEFLLLGTGPSLTRPSSALVRALEGQGIGVEAMDSRAAVRTWSVLRAEQRWIAAALFPLSG